MLLRIDLGYLEEHQAIKNYSSAQLSGEQLQECKDEIDNLLSDIESSIALEYPDTISSIQLKAIWSETNTLTIKARFVNDIYGACGGLFEIGKEEAAVSIYTLTLNIVNGAIAVAKLNEAMGDIQSKADESLQILYKWDMNEEGCSICDWDYDRIRVKLSKTAVESLIKLGSTGEELDTSDANGWDNVVQFLEGFNNLPLHIQLGACLINLSVEELICHNMLSGKDIMAIIRKNAGLKGAQKFKSLAILKELGKFAIIVYWDVDYTAKSIDLSIQNEKVLDIEDGRFISEHCLYSRIEARITIPENVLTSLFEDKS